MENKKTEMVNYSLLREKFKDGDWVFGLGKHKGCSPVFEDVPGIIQPFSYLDDYDPDNYRLATDWEIRVAKES